MSNSDKVLSFDLDDTLYDNTPVIYSAFARLYQYLCDNYPNIKQHYVSVDDFIASAALSRDRYPNVVDFQEIRHRHIADCLTESGYRDYDIKAAYHVFFEARQAVNLFPGVLPTLHELSQSFRLVGISNGNAEPRRIGLGTLLAEHFNPHSCGFAKPDPQMYEWVCNKLAIEPQQLVHIGDCLTNDVAAAQAAGCQAIWFNPKQKPFNDGPNIQRISQLIKLLPSLL
ncbi:MAG: HAD-IA family hydrolase [Enterobacterales bacterium]|nr:HAD-IA family hydrolase [Enterobacterales bacterium]